mmetsp:Transcript_2776/g.5775  ORF Transcript_2776/g.5775 Transcript_2776/m.5775 type:complete len:237 (+) Transcript_2776:22-732(+)
MFLVPFLLLAAPSAVRSFGATSSGFARHHQPSSTNTVLRAERPEQRSFASALLPAVAAASIALSLPLPVPAADDYDAVSSSVSALRSTAGKPKESLGAMREVYEIITEGKGLPGMEGRSGLVSEDDTSVYNPGLSILSQYEKSEILGALSDNRDGGLSARTWTTEEDDQYKFIRGKLDPLRMTQLAGYLGVMPVVGAVAYVGAIAVQQLARPLFTVAYIVAAAVTFGPIVYLWFTA